MPKCPSRYPHTIWARLPAAAADHLREIAAAEDRPLSAIVRRVVLRGLEIERESAEAQGRDR